MRRLITHSVGYPRNGQKAWIFLLFSIFLVGGLLSVSSKQAIGQSDIGIKGFIYGLSASAPTGQKPQSKLWFNDGIWWGVMYNRTGQAFEIYRLDWPTQTWQTTNIMVDQRARSSADALWTGAELVIASSMPPGVTTSDPNVYSRVYSYDPIGKVYQLQSTSIIWGSAVETIVIDQDTLGTIWATFTDNDDLPAMSVLVSHTVGAKSDWISPYVVPVAESSNLAIDDISTLAAYNGKIGVMWSNQVTGNINFAFHTDSNGDSAQDWEYLPAVTGLPKYADDHLNIKSLQSDSSGQLYAAVKTSLNESHPNSGEPLILLLRLDTQGSWSRRTVARVIDNHTRPIVLIDTENRNLYVFMTKQYPGQTNGDIRYKQINLDDPGTQFADGDGDPFIIFSNDTHINNATSTKQSLNGQTNLVVLASDDTERTYYHNFIDLQDPPPPPTYSTFLPLIVN